MFNLFGIPFPALPSQFLIHRRRSTPRTFGWVPALSFSVSCVDVLAGGKDMLERIWKSESHSWNMHAKRVKDFEEPLCLPWTTLSYCCLCPSFAKACVTWIHLVQLPSGCPLQYCHRGSWLGDTVVEWPYAMMVKLSIFCKVPKPRSLRKLHN